MGALSVAMLSAVTSETAVVSSARDSYFCNYLENTVSKRPSEEEVRQALDVIFAADSEIYQTRGFQRRIGFGVRPALLIIDLANAWTRPGHNFSCDGMDEIIPANQKLLEAARKKNIPIIYTSTAFQDPTGPRSDAGLWGYKIPAETCLIYTTDPADERSSIEIGPLRNIKKKK